MSVNLRKATTASILAILLVGIATATAAPARATRPTEGGGGFDLSIPEVTEEIRFAGRNVIVHVQGGGGLLWGTVEGIWIHDERSVVHLVTGRVTVNGVWDGDVVVDGIPGTIHVRYWGTADATTGVFQGRWVIISGTGELANLHGHGAVWVDESGVGGYTIQYHFDP